MKNNVDKAQQWADNLWKKAGVSWINRKQDLNYRKYVSRPAMEKAIKNIPVSRDGKFFDIGCGNGSETFHIADSLSKYGHSGDLIGVDQNELFIKDANSKLQRTKGKIETFFQKLSVLELVNAHISQADLIISVFLLQDLPDVEMLFKSANTILRKNGYGLFLLLHPDFAKKKMIKGYLKVEKKLLSRHWKWAAQYPIVEEGGKTFNVPYFHRTVCGYLHLARKYFQEVSFIDVLPSEKAIAESRRQKLSPLYSHQGNVYYPEIVKIPSSLIIKIQK